MVLPKKKFHIAVAMTITMIITNITNDMIITNISIAVIIIMIITMVINHLYEPLLEVQHGPLVDVVCEKSEKLFATNFVTNVVCEKSEKLFAKTVTNLHGEVYRMTSNHCDIR